VGCGPGPHPAQGDSSPLIFQNLRRLGALAIERRLPAISVFPRFAAAGGLMGYGPNLADLFRRAAGYVPRILKGAVPADLPVQRPVLFVLAINAVDGDSTRDDPASLADFAGGPADRGVTRYPSPSGHLPDLGEIPRVKTPGRLAGICRVRMPCVNRRAGP
jgi:hypothetical protein